MFGASYVLGTAHLKGSGKVEDDDLNNFRKYGFSDSKVRWEAKGYWFEPVKDPEGKKIKIIPRFFFEENQQIAKPHCIVTISDGDFRSEMGLDEAKFEKSTFQEDVIIDKKGIFEDNKQFIWYTMAHELGHATGLDDEYIEPAEMDESKKWKDPILPALPQWYAGMPYDLDVNSMMKANRAPRLRHLWIQCRWLNESPKVQALTGNTVFILRHEGEQIGDQGKKKHSFYYYLPANNANFYKPVYEEKDFKNGPHGKLDLFLYRLGQDEITKKEYVELIKNQSDFDGILVVRVNIIWLFRNYDGIGSDQWGKDNSAKIARMRNFQKSIHRALNKRFWLEKRSSDKKNISKIYLYFLPHHQFENNKNGTTGCEVPMSFFIVTVRADKPVFIIKVPPTETFSGDRLTIGKGTGNIAILRYILGMSYKDSDNNFITTISAKDIEFIKTWVEKKTGSQYELHSKR